MLKKYFLGKVKFQNFFEYLYHLSLAGMNIGIGSDVKNSGEIETMIYISKQIKNEIIPIVFDIGANIGNYTKEIRRVFNREMFIYCFEPSHEAFLKLKQSLTGYDYVRIFNYGFGERNETVPLYADTKGSGLGSVFPRNLKHLNIKMELQEQIPLVRLDDFCDDQKIAHIHLLKIDVEGNELNVLKGARNLIHSRSIDYIQFEFGGCNIDSRTYFRDFYDHLFLDYEIYRIGKDGLIPLEKYKETFEIFTTTNYLAVVRPLKSV